MPLHTILVAYDGSAQADDLLCLACDVAAASGTVVALYVTHVPSSLPITPLPDHVDATGNAALDHAERLLWRYDGVVEMRLVRAHRVADAIMSEAAVCEAEAIFLPLPSGGLWRRLRCAWLAWTVLRHAPCRVLLSYRPAQERDRAAAAGDAAPAATLEEPHLLRKLR